MLTNLSNNVLNTYTSFLKSDDWMSGNQNTFLVKKTATGIPTITISDKITGEIVSVGLDGSIRILWKVTNGGIVLPHYHPVAETINLLSGTSATVKWFSPENIIMQNVMFPGDFLRIPPGCTHEAKYNGNCEVFIKYDPGMKVMYL